MAIAALPYAWTGFPRQSSARLILRVALASVILDLLYTQWLVLGTILLPSAFAAFNRCARQQTDMPCARDILSNLLHGSYCGPRAQLPRFPLSVSASVQCMTVFADVEAG